MISLPKDVFEKLIEDAATRGARKALAEVGLQDEHAARDIRNLRDLLGAYRIIKIGALRQVGQSLALLVLGAIMLAVSYKLRLFGWH